MFLILFSGPIRAGEEEREQPPIPVRFHLDQPGYVHVAIDDAEGKRVRNLVMGRYLEAGDHTVWWNGRDETPGERGAHGVYEINGKLVEPGRYTVRVMRREEIKLKYETTVYNPGSPPWMTPDHSGSWLADHTPPWDVLYVPEGREGEPRIIACSHVVEHGHGLMELNLEGKKQWGVHRLGGAWTGATNLARDRGEKPDEDVYAYAASMWEGELRISSLHRTGSERERVQPVLKKAPKFDKPTITGMAVHNGLLLLSLPRVGNGKILFIDAKENRILETRSISNPGSLAFDRQGRLYMIQGGRMEWDEEDHFAVMHDAKLVRYNVKREPAGLETDRVLIQSGMDEPRRVVVGPEGQLYISKRGEKHQVQVYDKDGVLLRTIGEPGGPQPPGPYNPERMHRPTGITVTPGGKLWVAEQDKTPKRISVWTREGDFRNAFYGPPKYGGGGAIDPKDRNRFFYASEAYLDAAGMAFEINRKTDEHTLKSIYYRESDASLVIPRSLPEQKGAVPPQRPIYHGEQLYMTNSFNSDPGKFPFFSGVWMMREGKARPVAAVGQAGGIVSQWSLLNEDRFKDQVPAGYEGGFEDSWRRLLFAWSDLNFDGNVQTNELTFAEGVESNHVGHTYITRDLAAVSGRGVYLAPRGFTDEGVPVYRAKDAERVVKKGVRFHWGMIGSRPWFVEPGPPVHGYRNGNRVWTYPNRWASLHAVVQGSPPLPEPGMLIGTMGTIGYPVTPPEGDAGPIWAVNGYYGNVYLLTVDGFYVATLGRDSRTASGWRFKEARRGMDVSDVSFIEENFWPTINQTRDGGIYLVTGKGHSSIVRIEGLNSIERLKPAALQVTRSMIERAKSYSAKQQGVKLERGPRRELEVPILDSAPDVDGELADWEDTELVEIGRFTGRDGNRKSARAALAISGSRLYAAFRTGEEGFADNAATPGQPLFKTGGGLDLKLGTNPDADPERKAPVKGDLRLLVTEVDGHAEAKLYRPVAPGAPDAGEVTFRSPHRSTRFDSVRAVSEHVHLAGRAGNYEFSVPLHVLDLSPRNGLTIRGDIGLLRGRKGTTIHRFYWQNKGASHTSDVAGEAKLQPHLWGRFTFVG